MKKKILLTVLIFSIVSAQGEHPTGSKKAEHPTASIKPQIVQGEKITLQNLALAIESFVEADINLRGAFLVIDPNTEEVLKLTQNNSKSHVLDIGTGSGCILLSILKERKNFIGTGIDISKKCIKVSKYNAKRLELDNRTKFYISDVDNFLIGKYDVVVSNPPYIENLNLKYLDRDVVNFEPKLALSGGRDGFSEITKVINKTSGLIKKNGVFVLEIGHNQKNKVTEKLKAKGFYIKKVLKDYGKNDRCIISSKI